MKVFNDRLLPRAKRSRDSIFTRISSSLPLLATKIKNMLANESGQVLPLALILLVLGGLLVVPTLSLMSTSLNANHQVDTKNLELYAADAGVEEVMWHIRYEPGFALPPVGEQHPIDVPSINGDTVTAVLERPDAGQSLKIISTATSPNGHSTTVVCYLDVSGGADIWDFALASLGGDINLFGNSETNDSDEVQQGNIYSNGDISVSGNAEVNGDASAVGDISTSNHGEINGDQVEGVLPLVPVTIDTPAFRAEAENIGCESTSCGGTSYPGDLTVNSSQTFPQINVTRDLTVQGICTVTFQNTVCVHRNMSIGGITTTTFNGPVIVNGNLTINPTGTVNFNGIVCVNGNVNISGNSNVHFNGPMCINGNLSRTGNGTMDFGPTCFIGGSLDIGGNTDVPIGDLLYVVGDITTAGNVDLTGGGHVFSETGDISLSGNDTLLADDVPFIMAISGNVDVTGNADPVSAIIYAPDGIISLLGNCHLIGCAVGSEVSGGGNSEITYLMDLRDRDDLPGRDGAGHGDGLGLQIRSYEIE